MILLVEVCQTLVYKEVTALFGFSIRKLNLSLILVFPLLTAPFAFLQADPKRPTTAQRVTDGPRRSTGMPSLTSPPTRSSTHSARSQCR
jgi:hypothetical protein